MPLPHREAGVQSAASAPSHVDWRDHGVVPPVQDQGQAGASYIFSSTSTLESQAAIKHGSIVPLCPSFLLNCDHECGTYRNITMCDNDRQGLPPNAWRAVQKAGGQPTAGSDACRTCHVTGGTKVSGVQFASENETDMAAFVATNGPVSVLVDASGWQFYTGGIITPGATCPTPVNINHVAAIVGYGTDAGVPYWIVRNTWGADWGEHGYARIERNHGLCGVNLFAVRPIVA